MPSANNVVNLGESNRRFADAYINSLNVGNIQITNGIYSNGGIIAPVYYGVLRGGMMHDTTSTTNLNNLDTSALWWMNASGLTNIPSGLTGDFELEVRESGAINNNRITQKIYSQNMIYIRRRVSGTWSAWYKFTGT